MLSAKHSIKLPKLGAKQYLAEINAIQKLLKNLNILVMDFGAPSTPFKDTAANAVETLGILYLLPAD